jgi:hypothetical protein
MRTMTHLAWPATGIPVATAGMRGMPWGGYRGVSHTRTTPSQAQGITSAAWPRRIPHPRAPSTMHSDQSAVFP